MIPAVTPIGSLRRRRCACRARAWGSCRRRGASPPRRTTRRRRPRRRSRPCASASGLPCSVTSSAARLVGALQHQVGEPAQDAGALLRRASRASRAARARPPRSRAASRRRPCAAPRRPSRPVAGLSDRERRARVGVDPAPVDVGLAAEEIASGDATVTARTILDSRRVEPDRSSASTTSARVRARRRRDGRPLFGEGAMLEPDRVRARCDRAAPQPSARAARDRAARHAGARRRRRRPRARADGGRTCSPAASSTPRTAAPTARSCSTSSARARGLPRALEPPRRGTSRSGSTSPATSSSRSQRPRPARAHASSTRDGAVCRLTFAEVAADAARWANLLASAASRRGDRVLVLVGKTPDWLRSCSAR